VKPTGPRCPLCSSKLATRTRPISAHSSHVEVYTRCERWPYCTYEETRPKHRRAILDALKEARLPGIE
jgi:hypothetical protein